MGESLPNNEAAAVPVPTAEVTTEDQYKSLPIGDIIHFVSQ